MLPERRTSSCTTDPCRISNQRGRVRLADDDLRDVVGLREGDHVIGDAPPALGIVHGLGAEPFAEPERVGDPVALLFARDESCAGFSTYRTVQGACRRSASRLA